MNCYMIFIMFLVLIITISIFNSLTTCNTMIYGGMSDKFKHFNIDIWDKKCLDKDKDLKCILKEYKSKKIGNSLRKFIKFYKPTLSTRCIMKYLCKNNFKMFSNKLMLSGNYVSINGKKTKSEKMIAPHFIFYHKDHSCIRIKPIVGGWEWSSTFHPTLSMSIIYNTDILDLYKDNEAFKINRKGDPIPKAPSFEQETCINKKLPKYLVDEIMKSIHLKIMKPTSEDIKYYRSFELFD